MGTNNNDPYAEVYAYINDDERDYVKETTDTKAGTVAPVWEEEFTFDDAELTEGKTFTGFQFKLYDEDDVLGIGQDDFLGQSEIFHTADMKLCGDVYAMPMPLYRGTVEQGSVFVEVSMDNCCLEEDEETTEYEDLEEEHETATVEEQGKEKGSKPKD